MITFVSHTNRPGGGELALRRYLEVTKLPTRLVTMEVGGVWEGLPTEVLHAPRLPRLRPALRGSSLVVANSMRAAFLTSLVRRRETHLAYWVRDGLVDSAMSTRAITLTKHITARRTSHYLANSAWTARTIRDVLNVEPDVIDVIHSMCGVTEADLDRSPRSMPSSDAPLRLLFLGRLSPWKAPDVAVRALSSLRERGIDARLTIAGAAHFGEHTYVDELSSLVDSEPGATLVGHVADVNHLLDSHDVLVHCSTVPEPFGQVIVQGLAKGLPVVAPAAGGPAEILHGAPVETTYAAGDHTALASAVRRACQSYSEISQWALHRAQLYTDERAAASLDAVLSRLSSKQRP